MFISALFLYISLVTTQNGCFTQVYVVEAQRN